MSENSIRVTVTSEDVKDVPPEAAGPGSMLVILGTAHASGSRVAFKVSGRFILRVKEAGEVTLNLEPHEVLRDGQE